MDMQALSLSWRCK